MRTLKLKKSIWMAVALSVVIAPIWRGAAAQPVQSYFLYACAESEDEVALVSFTPGAGMTLVKNIRVGRFPAEIEGPHGISISADGEHWYLSLSHGFPFGTIHKYKTGTDEWVGSAEVGLFPATMAISPSTGLLFVVNFNLYGDMEPSTISVVETASMSEIAQIPTGIMPHGLRMNADGSKFYSVNMMNDELSEFDAFSFKLIRTLALSEHAPSAMKAMQMGGMAASRPTGGQQGGMDMAGAMADLTKPTWVTPPTAAGKVYVAGNAKAKIFEVDLEKWEITYTWEDVGKGVYNLDVTPDGKTLVATLKSNQGIGFFDLETKEVLGRIDTIRKIPHGIVVSPDGKYAFASVEGIGGEPGMIEAYEIATRTRVGSVEMGKQAGGLVFWKID